jgi:hypothetical protein
MVEQIKCYCGHTDYCDCGPLEEPKQETLEQASWRFNPLKKLDGEFLRAAFIKGAKWQAERMYSEEDMLEFTKYLLSKKVTKAKSISDLEEYLPKEFQLLSGELMRNGKELISEWFEQFKKIQDGKSKIK